MNSKNKRLRDETVRSYRARGEISIREGGGRKGWGKEEEMFTRIKVQGM